MMSAALSHLALPKVTAWTERQTAARAARPAPPLDIGAVWDEYRRCVRGGPAPRQAKGIAMHRILATISSALFVLAISLPAEAAELGAPAKRATVRHAVKAPISCSSCRHVRRCGPAGCGWRRISTGCADRYSCSPLYGAYDPYGGVGYWAAYSPGWGYHGWRP
jgi:hypothetical protein